MRRTVWLLGVALLCSLGGRSAFAEKGGVGLAVQASTLGAGAEVTAGINEKLNARVGINLFSIGFEGTREDINYDIDLGLLSGKALLDIHPTGAGFRLSGGLVLNNNKVDLVAIPTTNYTIGGKSYSGDQVGTLTGKFDFRKASPYVGLGWGNATGAGRKLGFALDLGVVLQGSPRVDLNATGLMASDPQFQQDLANEERKLKDNSSFLKYYPTLSIGVSYRIK